MLEPWKKLSEEKIKVDYKTLVNRMYRMPDGREELYTLFDGVPVVCVLALTPENNVVLARQYRPGPDGIYDELPGGAADKGEDPLEAVKREFLEETGYSGDFEFVATIPKSGYAIEFRHCFVATGCTKLSEPKHDQNEFIEIIEKPLKEFIDQARAGQMTDVDVAWLGLDYLKLI